MKLRRLCKDALSQPNNKCAAIYVDDEPAVDQEMVVCQVKVLDAATTAQLRDVAADELGGSMPVETFLRAAGLYLAERGRPGVLAEVEEYLAGMQR